MSESGSSERRPVSGRLLALNRAWIPLAVLLLLGSLLYSCHAYQYYMHDDEGSYAYAAWRVGVGEVPYRDFLSEQMPLFLYWGGLLVRLFGRTLVGLRLATMGVMLLAGCLLYAVNRELFGPPVAITSLGLFLIEPSVFHDSRFFRPEAYMLFFELAGFYAFVLGEKRRRLAYLGLAGLFFGLSVLCKLFGALPLAGCLAYLLYAGWRERRPWRQVLCQGLALGTAALVTVVVVGLAFAKVTPYFLTAVLGHHTMQGAGMPMLDRVRKGLALYRTYAAGHILALLLAAVGAGFVLRRRRAVSSLLLWQVPTALGFLVLSRDLQERHLAYLAPTLVTLAAVTVVHLLGIHHHTRRAGITRLGAAGLVAALVLAAIYPWLGKNVSDASLAEDDSSQIAAAIRSLASPDELVVCDYPGLNFLAGRRSTYWAAGISGGAAQSGQIRGAMLIDEMEGHDVAVVVINTWGGAHQMAAMADYPDFLRYIASHYVLAETYKCGYEAKVFAIYARPDALPPGQRTEGGTVVATGEAWIELHLGLPEDGVAPKAGELWAVVQWQDGTGAWHDVDGWRGPLEWTGEGEGHIAWAVGPTDLDTGPFRWRVLRGPNGPEAAASEPFLLPGKAGETRRDVLSLGP